MVTGLEFDMEIQLDLGSIGEYLKSVLKEEDGEGLCWKMGMMEIRGRSRSVFEPEVGVRISLHL